MFRTGSRLILIFEEMFKSRIEAPEATLALLFLRIALDLDERLV